MKEGGPATGREKLNSTSPTPQKIGTRKVDIIGNKSTKHLLTFKKRLQSANEAGKRIRNGRRRSPDEGLAGAENFT